LALVAWGCRLSFSILDEDAATRFIMEKGMHGPEGQYTKEGQFSFGLFKSALEVGNGKLHGYRKIECSFPSHRD